MVRHKQFMGSVGGGSAAAYFTENISASQFFDGGLNLDGQTFDYIGLSSREVDLGVFVAFERNLHPDTGRRLTPRTNTTRRERQINPKTSQMEIQTVANRMTGMDLPFLVPKTLSEVMAENPGEFSRSIERICVAANKKAMEFAETLALTRVRRGGAVEDRRTGNLLYLTVVHRDARPVGSNVPDPLWHSHNYIFNVTWDATESRLKAVQFHDIIKRADTIDAYFLSEIERGLTQLGVGTERTSDGRSFEITSVKGKEMFCKRRAEILEAEAQNRGRIECLTRAKIREARRLGKTLDYDRVEAEIRNELGNAIAKRKIVASFEEKLRKLREQMTPETRGSLQKEAVLSAPRINWRTADEAKTEVAITAFKNQSVVHELDIVGGLLRAAGGALRFEEAMAFARGPTFIHVDGEGHVTTLTVKKEQEKMCRVVRAGWDKCRSLIPDPDRAIRNPKAAASTDLAAAAQFIWSSGDGVLDMTGIVGAEKISLLNEIVPAITEARSDVILLAPTSSSQKKLEHHFAQVITLRSFQGDIRFQGKLAPGTVIVLDESPRVSVPQLYRLIDFVREKRCRLVLCGDSDRLRAVKRGDAVRILQESGAVRGFKRTEPDQAKLGYFQSARLDVKAHRMEGAVTRLVGHGDIREAPDPDELRRHAVEIHLQAARQGHRAISAWPIHSEALKVAEIVRQILKQEGRIGQADHAITRLTRVKAESIELRDTRLYESGRVISFHNRVKGGFRPGEKWRLTERLENGRLKLAKEGVTRVFDHCARGKWSIYETSKMTLSVGDQVRLTASFNEAGVAFRNNDILKVEAIDPDFIRFDDGRSLRRDFLHVDQGVCIGGYASQCGPVRQIVAVAPLTSLWQMNARTFCDLLSSATHRAVFLTDAKEAFFEAVLCRGNQQSVPDYTKSPGAAVAEAQGKKAKGSPKTRERDKKSPMIDL